MSEGERAPYFSSVHFSIEQNRADELRLLLNTTTDAVLFNDNNDLGLTPRQLAKKRKNRNCLKVINSFVKRGNKKISEKEHGHVFDCC